MRSTTSISQCRFCWETYTITCLYSDDKKMTQIEPQFKIFLIIRSPTSDEKVKRADYFWNNISVDEILKLLQKLEFPTEAFVKRGDGSYVIDYIRKCRNKLQKWDVVLDNVFKDDKNKFDKDLVNGIIVPRKRHEGRLKQIIKFTK